MINIPESTAKSEPALQNIATGARTGVDLHVNRPLQAFVRFVACIVLLAWIVGLLVWVFPAHNENGGRDFAQFYAAAAMIREGLGGALYDSEVQQRTYRELQIGPFYRLYNHPPFEAVMFVPLTYFSYRWAYLLCTITSLFLLLLCGVLLERELNLSRTIGQRLRIHIDAGLLIVAAAGLSPLLGCLVQGQDSVLLLTSYTLAFVLMRRKHPFLSGCALGLSLFKFQTVLPFAVILILRRQWKAVSGLAAVAGLLLACSIAVSGMSVLVEYPRQLADPEYWKWMDWYRPFLMANLRGLIYMLSGWAAGAGAGGLNIAVSTIVIGVTAYAWREDNVRLSFAAAVTATVLTTYHLYPYDLTLLLLPAALLMATSSGKGVRLPKTLQISLLILFFPPLHLLLLDQSLYALMALPILAMLAETVRLLRTPSACAISP